MDACRKMSANYVIDTETVRKENKCAITQFQIYGLKENYMRLYPRLPHNEMRSLYGW